ncbi:hypothetical protein Tco_0014161 [Tanacetum coccineum]
MHNNIMAAGSRDRPPMLATGRYAQWQSRFLRYIDTRPNGDALRKCILEGPYQPTTVTIPAVPATENSPAVPERTAVETILTMSPENKAHYESEKEAIHLLLTGIGDEIYSTVDACKTAHEMWIAIERLQQGESLNIQDVKTNLFWEFGKFTSHDGESMSPYVSDILNKYDEEMKSNNLNSFYESKNVHFLQHLQLEWSRSNASTKFKGKEIAKPITPPSESASEEDSDPEQAQRDKEINKNVDTTPRYKNDNQTGQFGNQRTMTVAGAREIVGSQMLLCKQAEKGVPLQAEQADWLEDTDEEINEQELEAHYNYMAKIQEVPTTDSGTDTEPLYNTCLVEKDDSNVTPDSQDMCDNDIQTDQNGEDERTALANLIANLKLNVDENKKIQKQLKKANASLAHESKECMGESNSIWDSCLVALQNKQTEFERYKALNDRTVNYEKLELVNEKHDELVKQSLLTKILYDQSDPANRLGLDREETLTLEKESRLKLNKDLVRPYNYTKLNSLYEIFKPASPEIIDELWHIQRAKDLIDQAWEKHSHNHFRAPTALDMEVLIKTCLMPLAIKTQNYSFAFVHELKQEMHADLKKSSFAKPYDVNAPGPSRNSPNHVSFQSPREFVGSNDMVHNYYLEEAKKKAQLQKGKALNTKPTQKKHVQSHKTTNRYIPIEKKSDFKNHGRQIPIGQRFSPNNSSNVYLKTTPPRSGLTWKPTGRIFTQVGLKWIPIKQSVETRHNTNDSASPLGKKTHNPNTTICANSSSLSAGIRNGHPNHRFKG